MKTLLDTLILQASSILLGKRDVVRLSIACLLARGHLLIEDVPGVGKTTLAHALAHLLGLSYRRIQFTSDLLPSDVTGVSIFERNSGEFRFHPGPIFSQVLLADEINRATPKAQSALLEAMEERQVSVEGETHPLPTPFFVIATQNPGYQIGTYPLPESQLDRFLMRISIGFPNAEAERSLLKGEDRRQLLARFGPVFSPKQLLDLQKEVDQIHASEAIYDYCQALLTFTRSSSRFYHGLSPRAGLGLLNAARAWALLNGRDFVLPEDVQTVLPSVAGHRLQSGEGNSSDGMGLAKYLFESVAVP
ncbi:MAG: AAA family ATPase [Gammaproteobacteria bacterium RIFOXYA12_FULL_61_12]|nr:MAG: AAA family ATPase [Gammaproteobacteria bacterium RIFOXYD12_FULL_61_37]OGT94494.1 MAG: AAA family ATPase [Gammaproteobacteria bacterium RIFOXYA12_FULL_61_12]